MATLGFPTRSWDEIGFLPKMTLSLSLSLVSGSQWDLLAALLVAREQQESGHWSHLLCLVKPTLASVS